MPQKKMPVTPTTDGVARAGTIAMIVSTDSNEINNPDPPDDPQPERRTHRDADGFAWTFIDGRWVPAPAEGGAE